MPKNVKQLSKKEMKELKERFLTDELGLEHISQGELNNANDIVTNELMYLFYEDTMFVKEDFFCNC